MTCSPGSGRQGIPRVRAVLERVSAEMPGSECCEHCAEIPLLREEVAALRARLNALTTLPLSASDPLPL